MCPTLVRQSSMVKFRQVKLTSTKPDPQELAGQTLTTSNLAVIQYTGKGEHSKTRYNYLFKFHSSASSLWLSLWWSPFHSSFLLLPCVCAVTFLAKRGVVRISEHNHKYLECQYLLRAFRLQVLHLLTPQSRTNQWMSEAFPLETYMYLFILSHQDKCHSFLSICLDEIDSSSWKHE